MFSFQYVSLFFVLVKTVHQIFKCSHQAAICVSKSYDALLDLFECVANFLNRLRIYSERIPLSPAMSDIVVKIMIKVLAVFALATKQIKQGRLSK